MSIDKCAQRQCVVAIHQPNYLPWLGYFYKMACCDVFVFLDNVQYPRDSICNRNKIKTHDGPRWLTVPVARTGLHTLITEARIDESKNWRNKHLALIRDNYRMTPYFDQYYPHLEEQLFRVHDSLGELNISLIMLIAGWLSLAVRCTTMSALCATGKSTALLVDICQKVGGTTYLSGRGGEKYQEETMFAAAGIQLRYTDFQHPQYAQQWGVFVPCMSVLDILFNCGPTAKQYLYLGPNNDEQTTDTK